MPTQTPRINLTKPDLAATPWKTELDQWADQVDKAAAQYLTIHMEGAATDEEVIFDGLFFDENVKLTEVTMYAREAPSGAALTFDILKDGSEMAKTFSVLDGAKKANAALSGVAFTTLEEFGLKVKNAGSTDPGSAVTIIIHYHIDALV